MIKNTDSIKLKSALAQHKTDAEKILRLQHEILRLQTANSNKVDIINALQNEFRQFSSDVDIEISRLKALREW